jgi:hypothetical protein
MRGKQKEKTEMSLQQTKGDKMWRVLKKVTIRYIIREMKFIK